MATAEEMQEALQQLQAQGARIAALETQLQIESARAQTAEQERSALIQTLDDDTPRTCRRHGRNERNQSALHSERRCRTRFWRVDTQSAYVHACKVWGSDSWCSSLGITSTENRCQSLRTFVERPLCSLDHGLWRTRRRRRTDRQHCRLCWKVLCLPCLLHNRRTQPNCSELWRRKRLGSLETIAQ